MAARRPTTTTDAATSPDTGGGTAVLDPPETTTTTDSDPPAEMVAEAPAEMVTEEPSTGFTVVDWRVQASKTPEGWNRLSGQAVEYLTDDAGRLRGADVFMWKTKASDQEPATYTARIRWQDGAFAWLEPLDDGWKAVQRGQDTMRLQPIIDQAIEHATNRVFSGWP